MLTCSEDKFYWNWVELVRDLGLGNMEAQN